MNVREDRRVAFDACWSFVVAWRTAEGMMMQSGSPCCRSVPPRSCICGT